MSNTLDKRNRLALRLDAIHVGKQLRHAVLKRRVRGVGVEFALLARLVEHFAGDPREFVVSVRPPVLYEQLESAGVAQALHRRRRHGEYHRILDGAEFLVEGAGDGRGRQVLGPAFLEGLQGKEHTAALLRLTNPCTDSPEKPMT